MKNKKINQKPTTPMFFDLRTSRGWEQLKVNAPTEIFAGLLQEIMSCPCCHSNEKQNARKFFESIEQ